MQASNRTVYGREFKVTPLGMWLLQRASGLLLGPLVALHIWSPELARSRPFSALLLVIVLMHGYTGLRRIGVKRNAFGMTVITALVWCAIVAIFGVLLVTSAGN
jgi:succinate dehydrogenase hydrophobic anchor subunit